jgi:putative amide transporter protein
MLPGRIVLTPASTVDTSRQAANVVCLVNNVSTKQKGGLKMVLPLLVIISLMWIPLGLFYLGEGDGKTCGAASGFVGLLTCVGAVTMALGGDAMNTILFGSFGIFYLTVAYCILAGIEDLRSLGNMSLTVALICAIACYFFVTGGGVKPDGTAMVGKSLYLAFMMITFVVLTVVVWGVTYGKVGAKLAGVLLVLFAIISLLVPAFDLLGYGKLPF